MVVGDMVARLAPCNKVVPDDVIASIAMAANVVGRLLAHVGQRSCEFGGGGGGSLAKWSRAADQRPPAAL